MRISDHSEDFLAVVTVAGELDEATVPELRDRLSGLIDAGTAWLLLDLRELEYIDSSGVGLLIGTARRAGEVGGELALICARPNVLRVFDISGTRELLNLRPEEAEARRLLDERREQRAAVESTDEGEEDE
jgi:anti-sigma B factor antagonist